jgi:hypothetical protein
MAPRELPQARPLPGKHSPVPVREQWEWANDQLQIAERVLFQGPGGCQFCHQVQPAKGPGGLPQIAGAEITDRWLKKSFFSHARHRHREWKCERCHARAPVSDRTSDVLLPRMTSCQECHTPTIGARSDCAECHRYHNRDLAKPVELFADRKDQ